jgi:hypothetical protein
MKPCRKNRRKITWLVMDALNPAEAAELVSHIGICDGCRLYRDEILKVKHCVSALQLLNPANALETEVFDVERTGSLLERTLKANLPKRSPFPSFRWSVGVSAACVFALALLLVVNLERPRPIERSSRHLAQHAPRVASGELLPSFANYRAIGNQSLDRLDQLLTQQSLRPLSVPQPPTAGSLGLPRLQD